MTDILSLVGIYYMLGGTITALFAASICGLLVSGCLHIANNKEQFLYLYDVMEIVKEKLESANKSLNEYGEAYKAKKELEASV